MLSYRIYELRADGQFAGPPKDALCRDDGEALKVAHGMMSDAPPEIWQGTRRLGYDGTKRAALWRAEAAAAKFDRMREFCKAEAERCEDRLRMSRSNQGVR
jgi:hypothetical protein